LYITQCTKEKTHIQNLDTMSHGVLVLARIHLKDKHVKKMQL